MPPNEEGVAEMATDLGEAAAAEETEANEGMGRPPIRTTQRRRPPCLRRLLLPPAPPPRGTDLGQGWLEVWEEEGDITINRLVERGGNNSLRTIHLGKH